ncbi:MAG TPA: hypothetical protein VK841_18010 [Polyangiaceae bacterium]|jgi:hypothetical protein|nr:hypothetical protein [Polyangiaceae bacterium]
MVSLSGNKAVRLALGSVFAVVAVALVVALRAHASGITLVWSLLMLLSFVGWGSVVNLWLTNGRRVDWGLRAGWGMAFVLLVGGYLTLIHAARGPVLIAQVAVGVGAFIWLWANEKPRPLSRRRLAAWIAHSGVLILLALSYAVAALIFVHYAGKHEFQPSDDQPLYFEFAKKLIDIGSLYEPFNSRRFATLGGQPYLHGLFASLAPFYCLPMVDGGIGLALAFGLVVGHVTRNGIKGWHAVPLGFAMCLFFTLTGVHLNIASETTGIPVVLTMYRTLRFPLADGNAPQWPYEPRRILALGVLLVVAIILRPTNGPALLPFLLLVFASDYFLGTRRPFTRQALLSFVSRMGLFSAAIALTLLPWSWMLYQSCGTFFYPIWQGNMTPGWVFLKTAPMKQAIQAWFSDLTYDKPICFFLLFLFAGFVPMRGRARNDIVFLTVGSLLGIWSLARAAGAFDSFAHARYMNAYVAATGLIIAMSLGPHDIRAALLALAVGLHVALVHDEMRGAYIGAIDVANHVFTNGDRDEREFSAGTAAYTEIQSHIDPGATFACAVHEPWRFDFKRNRIYTLDVLGGTGPKPGWPAFKGAQALLDYFRANGIRYVVWTNFDTANELYNRAHWAQFKAADLFLSGEAPFHIDGMDSIEKFASMRHVVYRAHQMTVVDLNAMP